MGTDKTEQPEIKAATRGRHWDARAGSGQAAFRLHQAGGAPEAQESKSLGKACQAAPKPTNHPIASEAKADLAY